MMNFLKKVFAYAVAFIVVITTLLLIKQTVHGFPSGFMVVVGSLFVCGGLFAMFWPKVAMRGYEKGQLRNKRWREKYPRFMQAYEEVSSQVEDTSFEESVAAKIYARQTRTRLFGVVACIFGSLAFWIGLFG